MRRVRSSALFARLWAATNPAATLFAGLWALAEYVAWRRFRVLLRTISVVQPGDRTADRALVNWYLASARRERSPLTISAASLRRFVGAVAWEHYYDFAASLLRPNGTDAHARLLAVTAALCGNAGVAPPPPTARAPRHASSAPSFGTTPLVVSYKPLVLEALVCGARLAATAALHAYGFRRRWVPTPEGWIGVWARPQRRGPPLWPAVFVHGLGMGAAPYVPFLQRALGDRTMLLLELPNVSRGHYQTCMPSASNLRRALAGVLRRERVPPRCWILMGHSLGTDVCSMLLNATKADEPEPGAVVLLDPICFAHEFAASHSSPVLGTKDLVGAPILARLLHVGVFQDVYSQQACLRFLGNGPEAIFRSTTVPLFVGLGGRDKILPAASIADYVRAGFPNATVHFHLKRPHGGFLWRGRGQDQVGGAVAAFLDRLAGTPQVFDDCCKELRFDDCRIKVRL